MENDLNDPIQDGSVKIKSNILKNIIPLMIFIIGVVLIRMQPIIAFATMITMIPWLIAAFIFSVAIIIIIGSDNRGINVRVYNPERGNKYFKILGLYVLVAIGLIIVSVISLFLPGARVDKSEFVKIHGIEIPTLYKYTQYEEPIIFSSNDTGIENGVKLKVHTKIYENDIPLMFIKDFEEGLKEDGYVKVTKGEGMMFVKNNANGGFSYVYIAASCNEIEYGASANGTYDLILDRQKH